MWESKSFYNRILNQPCFVQRYFGTALSKNSFSVWRGVNLISPRGQTACLPLTKGLGCHDWRRIWNTIPNIRRVYKAALRFVHSPWTKVAWIWMLTDSIRQDLKTNCYRAVSYDLKKCQSSFMWTICGKVSEGRPVIAWCHGREGSAFFYLHRPPVRK